MTGPPDGLLLSTTTPRVSVGIPVRNGWPSLQRAVAGVRAQTFADFELLIADNASTDFGPSDIAHVVEPDPRIRYIRHSQDIGAAANFAAVLQAARGRYFMWHGGDDLITPAYLQRCVEVLDARPDVVMVTCVRTDRISRVEIADGFVGFEEESAEGRLTALLDAMPDRNARFYSLYRRDVLMAAPVQVLARYAGDWGLVASVLARGKSVVHCDREHGYVKARGGTSEDPAYTRRALRLTEVVRAPFAALEDQLPAAVKRRRRLKRLLLRALALNAWLMAPGRSA